MASSLLTKMSSSSCCSPRNVEDAAASSINDLVSMAILAYKPDSTWVLTLNNAIAMSKYPTFVTLLSCERLYKAS
jgi:hypothetical protein